MYILLALFLLSLISSTILYLTRSRWIHHIPNVQLPWAKHIYSRVPTSFAGDIEAGLSSSTFDLNTNLENEDGRAGLDDAAKREVLSIMKKRRMNFDQARKVYMQNRFKANGIGPDGLPRDPKFVSFS